MSRVDAVIETYRRVGPAMTQTTIVGGLGLFVFALSTFILTIGTLMLVMLATALAGDLILLPRCWPVRPVAGSNPASIPRRSPDTLPESDDSPTNPRVSNRRRFEVRRPRRGRMRRTG